ncbi:VanZ family protein [Inconstantimicrobium mannanitabidum]|uniref:Uncharacterized protein n=1 Tax=Inconstantimicrobium mannanitabidum TaxID=1604901 RepID=A0ACB5RA28_9CLOT|nr:VanZ family protein [Clostridium sp. TW13]GKX65884.1 hypothetical protein rsdtw13_11420 [Clostridium sp. TW13]
MKVTKKSKSSNIILWCLFIIYLALLIKVIFFKYPLSMISVMLTDYKQPLSSRIEYANFIPTKSIFHYLSGKETIKIAVENLLGNIIAFGPLGFFLPTLLNWAKKFRHTVFISFIVSLSFEVIQLLTAIGDFDVDDIILNVLGAMIGFGFYKVIMNIVKLRTSTNINL